MYIAKIFTLLESSTLWQNSKFEYGCVCVCVCIVTLCVYMVCVYVSSVYVFG